MKKYIFTLIVFFCSFISVNSMPGDLDTSFDMDGKVTTVVQNGSYSRASDIAIQPDGKLVVVGLSRVSFGYFSVVRYKTDGSLDPTFDTDGIVITPFPDGANTRNQVAAVVLQPDGKILVAGTFGSNSGDNFVVVRYNSDGSLDPDFDADGVVRTVFVNGEHAGISGMKIQSDGKILVAGNTGSPKRIALVRYNPNGSLDTTFGTDGKVDLQIFNAIHSTTVNDIALQSNGNIVVAGWSVDLFQGVNFSVVVSLNPNGSLNMDFDGDGIAVIIGQTRHNIFYGVAVQPNNKIVAGGVTETFNQLDYNALVARYNTDGTLDTNFDGDGIVITSTGPFSNSGLVDVAIQGNGKIVALGGFYGDFLLARYNSDGSLDNSLFGNGGIVSTDFSNSGDFPSRLLIQSDGNIVAAGYTSMQNSFTEEFAAARYIGDSLAPTSANVSISGRVINSGGQGIGKVRVSLTDSSGATRIVSTGSFGYYKFDEVPAGQTYILTVNHKRYVFEPNTRVLNVAEDLNDVDFTANKLEGF